ncbi:MAG: GNAT family N-acetyltransferase [Sediminibacterium sp.]|nr:GNAT family N-acetyltransferase [Sediminibacterium sp.]
MFSRTPEPLSEQSIPHLLELFVELWPDCAPEEERAACYAMLSSETETCFLLKSEDIYFAFVHVSIRTDYVEGAETDRVAYIEGLYIREAFRKQGAGQLLIKAAENWARQHQCTELASDTESTNTHAIAFHLKTGFTEANRVVCFIKPIL